MTDTAETLRTILMDSRPERSGDGYPPEVRERVGRWAATQQAAGTKLTRLAPQLGISATSLRNWMREVDVAYPARPSQFLPVVVKADGEFVTPMGGMRLHTPQGYWVSGLGLNELVVLLRGLE